jgi:N-acetylglutamate synthase-like GNAT family acetyltransferase
MIAGPTYVKYAVFATWLTFQAFVCEADSKIIGFAAVDKYASDAVQLTHFYVSGAYRMNGTGKALVNMILQSVGPNSRA